jgi:hypothetical protein
MSYLKYAKSSLLKDENRRIHQHNLQNVLTGALVFAERGEGKILDERNVTGANSASGSVGYLLIFSKQSL